eukprot:9893_1
MTIERCIGWSGDAFKSAAYGLMSIIFSFSIIPVNFSAKFSGLIPCKLPFVDLHNLAQILQFAAIILDTDNSPRRPSTSRNPSTLRTISTRDLPCLHRLQSDPHSAPHSSSPRRYSPIHRYTISPGSPA